VLGAGMTVAAYVAKHLRKIWGFLAASGSDIPLELIVVMAQAFLKDSHMPYTRAKLQEYLPKVPCAILDDLISWQSDALAEQFLPRQHRKLAANQTVPFRGVRQTGGSSMTGASGTVVTKVKETRTELFYARKTGTVADLSKELEVLSTLPELAHNITLRASYQQGQQLHIIMSPWADTDLGEFLELPTILPSWPPSSNGQRAAMLFSWIGCLSVGLAKLHIHCEAQGHQARQHLVGDYG
jgi:hypothetical protein